MSEALFKVGDVVETIKGAKFWGEVVSYYRIAVEGIEPMQPCYEWRCDVRATAPDFLDTTHVYPARQLALRALASPASLHSSGPIEAEVKAAQDAYGNAMIAMGYKGFVDPAWIRAALRAASAIHQPGAGEVVATISELEAILNSEDPTPVHITPDGRVVHPPSPPAAKALVEALSPEAKSIVRAWVASARRINDCGLSHRSDDLAQAADFVEASLSTAEPAPAPTPEASSDD